MRIAIIRSLALFEPRTIVSRFRVGSAQPLFSHMRLAKTEATPQCQCPERDIRRGVVKQRLVGGSEGHGWSTAGPSA
jgi:hypothetical protein